MANRGPNLARRADLKAAIKRTPEDATIGLDHLAVIWGVVKTRFVNVYKDIEATIGWPTPRKGPNNTHLYPAREALQKMLDYEMRNDGQAAERQKTVDRILGRTKRKARAGAGDGYHMPVNEMATLHRLSVEIEERERAQRLYIPVSEVAATAAETFAIFSEFCNDLDNRADPNGELPGPVRSRIKELGAGLQLRIHAEMRDLLKADVDARSGNIAGDGRAPRRARRTSARR